ncbi:DUF6985 domain-containing protein [Stieleria tagensis]|uniref:DUF6985 domain-containing protein n=1 Tax=Stieleria tagensis TaxID=2956795 RepID=UPI0036F2374E
MDCPVDPTDFGLSANSADEIRNHYRITSIWLLRNSSPSNRYLNFSGDCDWDPEHGLDCYTNGGEIIGKFETDLPD